MNPDNRRKLNDRVIRAAEAALAAQNYVSSIDVLAGIGWLDPDCSSGGSKGRSAISRKGSRPIVAYLGGHEPVSVVGHRKGFASERDTLRGAEAVTPDASV